MLLARVAVLALLATSLAAQHFQFMADLGYAPRFTPPLPTTTTHLPPVGGDFDGDGRMDLLVPDVTAVALYMGQSDGRYVRAVGGIPLGLRTGTAILRVHDMDGDSDLDVLILDAGILQWWGNDGRGVFAMRGSALVGVQPLPGALDVADVDGDGDLDVVCSGTLYIYFVRQLASGALITTLLRQQSAAISVAFCDVDRDGDVDLVNGHHVVGGYQILRNDGFGNFLTTNQAVPFPYVPSIIRAADVDADGDMDLVAVSRATTSVMLVINDNAAGFVDRTSGMPVLGPLALNGENLLVEDFDLDGDVDVICSDTSLHFLRNSGAGTFALAQRWGVRGVLSFVMTASDMDGDGDLDIGFAERSPLGVMPRIVLNHARHLYSVEPVQLGGSFKLDLFSGPGYAPPAITPILAGLSSPFRPVQVPGFGGSLDLSPATSVIATVPSNSSIGVSRVFLSVPNQSSLAGTSVRFQSAIVPLGGTAIDMGFTNVVLETVWP